MPAESMSMPAESTSPRGAGSAWEAGESELPRALGKRRRLPFLSRRDWSSRARLSLLLVLVILITFTFRQQARGRIGRKTADWFPESQSPSPKGSGSRRNNNRLRSVAGACSLAFGAAVCLCRNDFEHSRGENEGGDKRPARIVNETGFKGGTARSARGISRPQLNVDGIHGHNHAVPRCPFVPFPTVRDAILEDNNLTVSSRVKLLNGEFLFDSILGTEEKFKMQTHSSNDIEEYFKRKDMKRLGGKTVELPGTHVQTGWYRKKFTTPRDWVEDTGKDGLMGIDDNQDVVLLRFEGAGGPIAIWVNNKYAGFARSAEYGTEFLITPFLNFKSHGENTLDFLFIQDSECKSSCMIGDIYMMHRPSVYIKDITFLTSCLDTDTHDGMNAELHVKVKLAHQGQGVKQIKNFGVHFMLIDERELDLDGDIEKIDDTGHPVTEITRGNDLSISHHHYLDARKYSGEIPYLYTLVVSVVNSAGYNAETITLKVGFRNLKFKGKTILYNKAPLKLQGAWPLDLGELSLGNHPHQRQLSIRETLQKIRGRNVNTILVKSPGLYCSYLYRIAEEIGLYVVNEISVPVHSSNVSGVNNGLSRYPILTRLMDSYDRDKNYNSLVGWSLVARDELSDTRRIEHSVAASQLFSLCKSLKEVDYYNRLIMCDLSVSTKALSKDLHLQPRSESLHSEHAAYGADAEESKNSNHNPDKQRKPLTLSGPHPGDVAILRASSIRDLRKVCIGSLLPVVVNYDINRTNDWEFGKLWDDEDRNSTSGFTGMCVRLSHSNIEVSEEVKRAYSPIQLKLLDPIDGKVSFEVFNRNYFKRADIHELQYSFLENGVPLIGPTSSGAIRFNHLRIRPRQRCNISLRNTPEFEAGKRYGVRTQVKQIHSTVALPSGHEVFKKDFRLPSTEFREYKPPHRNSTMRVVVERANQDGMLWVSVKDPEEADEIPYLLLGFSRNTGRMESLWVQGNELLPVGLGPTFIGSPVSGKDTRRQFLDWTEAGDKDKMESIDFHLEYDRDKLQVSSLSIIGDQDNSAVNITYSVHPTGEIIISQTFLPDPQSAETTLPGFGLLFHVLHSPSNQVQWLGFGPHDSFEEFRGSNMLGIHQKTLDSNSGITVAEADWMDLAVQNEHRRPQLITVSDPSAQGRISFSLKKTTIRMRTFQDRGELLDRNLAAVAVRISHSPTFLSYSRAHRFQVCLRIKDAF